MNPIRLVDTHLVSEHEARPRIPGRYWASDAGDCKRKLYYLYTDQELTDPLDAHTLRKFAYGNKVEEQEIEWFYESGQAIDDHVKINKPNPESPSTTIAGEIDVLMREVVDDEIHNYIVEIKTGYGHHFKNKALVGRPNPKHLLQGMLYLDMSEINDLMFVYIDRGTCDRREHHLTLENGYPVVNGQQLAGPHISTLYKVFALLHKMVKNHMLPPPDFKQEYDEDDIRTLRHAGKLTSAQLNKWKNGESVGDWECQGCVFRSLCADS